MRRTTCARRVAGAVLVAFWSALPLAAQDRIDPAEVSARTRPYVPKSQYKFRAEAALVEVGVVVRDRQGRAVGGLQRSDFEIRDEGKKREITAFSIHTFVPAGSDAEKRSVPAAGGQQTRQSRRRFVGLLFDDLNSNLAELRNSQVAARRFVTEGLAASDQVAIFTTGSAQITPFSADVPTLVKAIEGLRTAQKMIDGGSCPHMTPYDAYMIAEKRDATSLEVKVKEAVRCSPRPGWSDALFPSNPAVWAVHTQARVLWLQVRRTSQSTLDTIRNIVDHVSKQPGDRLLVLASGGFLSGSLEWEQEDIIARALRGGVVVSSIDAKGLFTADPVDMPPGGNEQSVIRAQILSTQPKDQTNDALVYLAQATGGLFFSNNNDLVLGFRQLGMLPEVTYLLGFSPEGAPDGKFHKLSVRIGGERAYAVQARPGYFAVMNEPATAGPERRIDREVLATTTLTEVPIRLAPMPGSVEGGITGLAAVLHVDLNKLPLLNRAGNRTQQLTFIAALLDEGGSFVAGREGVLDLALKEATLARLSKDGLNVRLQIEAPPGTYHLRFVVEEASEGKISASTQIVEVR